MKELYVCEKCGKTFEDYNKAWKCECSHIEPNMIVTCIGNEIIPPNYKEGDWLPNTIEVEFVTHEDDTTVYSIYTYQLKKQNTELTQKMQEYQIEQEKKRQKENEKKEQEKQEMLKQLEDACVSIDEKETRYYWSVKRLYEKHILKQE